MGITEGYPTRSTPSGIPSAASVQGLRSPRIDLVHARCCPHTLGCARVGPRYRGSVNHSSRSSKSSHRNTRAHRLGVLASGQNFYLQLPVVLRKTADARWQPLG